MWLLLMKNKMPLKDDMKGGVPVTLYLKNEGQGKIVKIISAKIDISDLEDKEVYCSATDAGEKYKPLIGLEKYISGKKIIGSGDEVKAVCISKIPDISVEQKSYIITGTVTYIYEHTKEKKMKIDFGAMSLCVCEDDEGNENEFYLNSCDGCTQETCSKHGYGKFKECIGPKD